MNIPTIAILLVTCLLVWGIITIVVFSATMLSSQISQWEEEENRNENVSL